MTRTEFVAHLDVEHGTLEFWLTQAWLVPERREAELAFSATDLARGRLILDLTNGFGVNDEGIDVILHLIDQLHGARQAFADLQAEMKGR